MTIESIAATNEDIPALRRLMQFYLYDIASLDHWDIGADGFYGNPQRIESFWDQGRYDKLLIKVDGILAGFALTTSASDGSGRVPMRFRSFLSCAGTVARESGGRSPPGFLKISQEPGKFR